MKNLMMSLSGVLCGTAFLATGLMSTASATVPNMSLIAGTQTPNQGTNLLPPAQCGECFARILIPSSYKVEKVKVRVQEASERLAVTPPEFSFEEQTIQVSPAYKKLKAVQAKYSTVTERIVDTPTHKIWKKGKGPFQTIDNATGEIMCLMEVPETYQTYRRTVVAAPAQIQEVPVAAKFQTVRVKKLAKPATVVREQVPEEFAFLDQQVKVGAARIEWQPILCQTNATRGTIRSIQRALKTAGHDPGYVGGVLNRNTVNALKAFQAKNNLPAGHVTVATLKALNVKTPCLGN
ncbi:MAG: hypothetical protein ACI9MR_003811 [Myxococcota bacterium]|jgi:hypothetical protein